MNQRSVSFSCAASKLFRHIRPSLLSTKLTKLVPVLESYVDWEITGGYNRRKISLKPSDFSQSRSFTSGSYFSDFTRKILSLIALRKMVTREALELGGWTVVNKY